MTSKSLENVLAEASALLQSGYQEIVLTGIRLGLYRGSDAEGNKYSLLAMLKKLTALHGRFRIRLSSLEVTEVTDDLIDFVKDSPKMCRHFHIPMQSGDSTVLKDMKRWYNVDFYKARVAAVRTAMPDCGVTADVMVGYPTETDEQFETTRRNIDEMNLSGLHVFRFSARETTPAAALTPLDPRIVTGRAHVLGALDEQLRARFYRRFEGQEREILPEPTGEAWTDNYIRVDVPLADTGMGLHRRPVASRRHPPRRIGADNSILAVNAAVPA
jgi:threonylcarbamoyladenosine tRNA methylthiotransferase MtaB